MLSLLMVEIRMGTHDQESHSVHVVADRFADILAGLRQLDQSCGRHIGLAEHLDHFLPKIEVKHTFVDYRLFEERMSNLLKDESHAGLRSEITFFEVRFYLNDPFLDAQLGATRKLLNFSPHIDSLLIVSCLPN